MLRLRWGRVVGCFLGLAGFGLLLWSCQFWLPSVIQWMHSNLFPVLYLACLLGYAVGYFSGEDHHRKLCEYGKSCYDPSHKPYNENIPTVRYR